jgi:hypothetical protein
MADNSSGAEVEHPGSVAPRPHATRIHAGLLATLAAVGEVVRARVEASLANGGPEPDAFRGLHIDVADVERLLARRPLDWRASQEQERRAFQLPPEAADSPLGVAKRMLGLNEFETVLLALCALPEIDGRYAGLFGFLQDDITRKEPSIELALSLFAQPGAAGLEMLACFGAGAPLNIWHLIRPLRDDALITQSLGLERSFLWFLLGKRALDVRLTSFARVLSGQVAGRLPVASDLVPVLVDRLSAGRPILLHGEDEQACLGVAAAASAQMDRTILLVDGPALLEGGDVELNLQHALRESLLKGMYPCITGAGSLLNHATLAGAFRERLLCCPLPPILMSQDATGETAYAGARIIAIAVPAPQAADRHIRWRAAASARGIHLDEDTLLALAETEGLSGATIDEVSEVAVATAAAAAEEPTGRHVQEAARSALRPRAPTLPITAPRFTWDDLVLREDRIQVLRHLCSRVRYRSQVRHAWGVGRGTMPGLTALFAGQPGTGKSMAAEVIARDLGLDVCKIDLAQVVSKYIGETEKNLAKIFSEAEQCGVVLVFDEADALFAKRSEVSDSHDRYANIETSYLLQRMERYRGLAVLTTNLRANLDEAFTRRIGVSIDFPMPAGGDRLRLWQRALAGAPCDPNLNLRVFADRLELAGGSIVNAALAAAYVAAEAKGAVSNDALLRAVRWELQKAGRLMGAEALDALLPATLENPRPPRP